MKEENKPSREELKRLVKESAGALSWVELSEPLEKRLERIEGKYPYFEHQKYNKARKWMIKRDFTFAKYVGLCEKILESDYELLTVERYLTMKKDLDKFIIMRHDVDDGADLPYTLAMARKEADLGISATYYFRVNEDVFKPEIIRDCLLYTSPSPRD